MCLAHERSGNGPNPGDPLVLFLLVPPHGRSLIKRCGEIPRTMPNLEAPYTRATRARGVTLGA